nr:cytochrome P450 2J6-like isoform X2 [Dromaius novaehollandiae]XP_025950586.1 cytochrome P450 2J6-like isoform X2 [Dromaius novaehollandiae]
MMETFLKQIQGHVFGIEDILDHTGGGEGSGSRNKELAKIHGNVFTLWFGWAPVIILNGFQAVKDGMTTHPEDISGRLVSPFFRAMAKGKGIMLATGHTWKQQRRFALRTLRNLGLGKRGLEHRVQEEACYLVEYFASMKEKPLDPSFPLFHSVSNVICAVVFGHRFSSEDETFHELIKATECIFKFGGSFIHYLYEIFPWLMHHLPGPHKKALSSYDALSSFARREIRRHKERGVRDEPQDFIDFYLAHIEKSKDEPRSTYDDDNLVYSINDLFLGGSETSSTTLNWGLLYMVANPDIQEKVQEELDAVLGPSQLICYEDRRRLPYTNAVVHEVQRFSNIISVGMPRVCVRNTTLLGFPLKKGSIVLPNIASSLYDPEQWETPRQFNPGHFLDKDGNFVSQEAFLPFSIDAEGEDSPAHEVWQQDISRGSRQGDAGPRCYPGSSHELPGCSRVLRTLSTSEQLAIIYENLWRMGKGQTTSFEGLSSKAVHPPVNQAEGNKDP